MDSKHQKENLVHENRAVDKSGCTKTIKKNVSVVVSVTVKPTVMVKESEVKIMCTGPLLVSKKKKKISKKDECQFIIKQDLSVNIPMNFKTDAEVKAIGVICNLEKPCK
jgi:hypothetical protein